MARPEPPMREPDDYEGVAADLAEFGVVYIRDDSTPCPQCGRGPMELRHRGARPVREILECVSCGWPSRVYC